MHAKVSDLVGFQAATHEDGERVRALIEPPFYRGEQVVLAFEGVRYFVPGFFFSSIGALIEKDVENRVDDVIRLVLRCAMAGACVGP